MSKEKQIEKQAIEEMAKFLWKNTLIHTEDLCHDVAETLVIEGYRKQSGWISVEERLPEEDTIVLVWCGEYAVYNYLRDDMWYTGYCDISTDDGGITHWMPLPEAPKGDAE